MNRNKNYFVFVKGDTNDADYISEISTLSGAEIEDYVLPVLKKMKEIKALPGNKYGFHSWDSTGWDQDNAPDVLYGLDDKTFALWQDIIPYGEQGIHSIESVEIWPTFDRVNLMRKGSKPLTDESKVTDGEKLVALVEMIEDAPDGNADFDELLDAWYDKFQDDH